MNPILCHVLAVILLAASVVILYWTGRIIAQRWLECPTVQMSLGDHFACLLVGIVAWFILPLAARGCCLIVHAAALQICGWLQ
jgi:hypothetical protein